MTERRGTGRLANRRMQSRTFVWHLSDPPAAAWPVVADTARFNEAARLPKHEIEEIPRADGSVLYLGHWRRGPMTISWRECPANWVAERWFEHRREFRNGPLAVLTARMTLSAEGAGCRMDYTVDVAPANLLGRIMLATKFFDGTRRKVDALVADAERCAADAQAPSASYRPPVLSDEVRDRIDGLVGKIEDSTYGHGLARRLADWIAVAQEVDLVHIRPLALARMWSAPPRHAIELCLQAARVGLLDLRWDLLCPRCRIAKANVPGLAELPRGAHCDTCNIDYERDYSMNVEASFAPAPQVRPIGVGEYCLFGPMSTPHVRAQVTLEPGAERVFDAAFAHGIYRLRTLEPGPETQVEIEDDGAAFPEVILDNDAVRAGAPAAPGTLVLRNRAGRELTAIVEELHWVRDALTADRVTALQAFRDLFSDQVLRPGDEVSIRRVAFMFTDLRGSTALYDRVGDAEAYRMVRRHFAALAEIVRAHDGAIVKTIGDAIMAAFSEPAAAVRAALQIQEESDDPNLVIKLGLHQGSSIAVALNDRLDYFGSAVNMAARLQAQSTGGDIVLSVAMAEDPAVRPLLAGLDRGTETVDLKGFPTPVPFVRVHGSDTKAPSAAMDLT